MRCRMITGPFDGFLSVQTVSDALASCMTDPHPMSTGGPAVREHFFMRCGLSSAFLPR